MDHCVLAIIVVFVFVFVLLLVVTLAFKFRAVTQAMFFAIDLVDAFLISLFHVRAVFN